MNAIVENALLETEVQRYLVLLEELFGKKDPNFVFSGIDKSQDGTPRPYFLHKYDTLGRREVLIHVSFVPGQQKYTRGHILWQLAHECVHLMDPNFPPPTNNLEEGIASWFQDCTTLGFHRPETDEFIHRISSRGERNKNYELVRDVVRSYCPSILGAIKQLRGQGERIGEINPKQLIDTVEGIDVCTAEFLADRFPNSMHKVL